MQVLQAAGVAVRVVPVRLGLSFSPKQVLPAFAGVAVPLRRASQPVAIVPPVVISPSGQALIAVSMKVREFVSRGGDKDNITEFLYADAERRNDAVLVDLLDTGVAESVIVRTLANMEGVTA